MNPTDGGTLTVDLGAIAANYRLLADRVRTSDAEAAVVCAAVVKADAYGLGADRVAPTLAAAGCRVFFVATLSEAVDLRTLFRDAGIADNRIEVFVLNGAPPDTAAEVTAHRLVPVLNSLPQMDAWATIGRDRGIAVPAAVHVDTGMSRLGLSDEDVDRLATQPERLDGIDLCLIMSHLACAEEQGHPLNAQQRQAFIAACQRLPKTRASLANSSGIFLGTDYHANLVRPGAALYGVSPTPDRPNPMQQVVTLTGRIIQVRTIDRGRTVGYGATHIAPRRQRIATVAVGYADGYPRALGNCGRGFVGEHEVPVVGRISMDLTTFDVTDAPEFLAAPGRTVELIGAHVSVDQAAEDAGTIGYEILTRLGRRYVRRYIGDDG